jgi:large subunit ribosomal protein L37e
LSRVSGKHTWHKQKKRDASSGYPGSKLRRYNWAKKAIRRRAQGRMKYLKHIPRRAKNGFREGTKPVSRKRRATTEKK